VIYFEMEMQVIGLLDFGLVGQQKDPRKALGRRPATRDDTRLDLS
jgi:hypothetical protein